MVLSSTHDSYWLPGRAPPSMGAALSERPTSPTWTNRDVIQKEDKQNATNRVSSVTGPERRINWEYEWELVMLLDRLQT
jgi:hypothetical protein